MSRPFEHVPMVTVEEAVRVHDPAQNEVIDDVYRDGVLAPAVAEVSSQFTAYLGQHTLRKEYTERHAVAGNKRTLTLSGGYVDPDSLVVMIDDEDVDEGAFTLYEDTGWLRFPSPIARKGEAVTVEVEYTGGMAASTAEFAAKFPDLHSAALLQVQYRLESRDSLGGSISVPQGMSATKFGEYGFLRRVQQVLDRYRRWSL